MLKKQRTRKLLKVLGFLLLVASLFYLTKTIAKFEFSFLELLLMAQTSPYVLVFCTVLYIMTYILGSIIWSVWVLKLDDRNKLIKSDFLVLMAVYFYTNLQKYIPGNIFQFVGRNLMGSQYGFRHKSLFTASIFEVIISVFSGLVFVLLILPFFWQEAHQIIELFNTEKAKLISVSVLIIMLLLMVWAFKNKSLTLRDFIYQFHGYKKNLSFSIVAFLITFALFGLINLLLFNGLFDFEFSLRNFSILAFGFTVSWLVGFIVPGSPGGIVIREAVFVLMLNGFVTEKELIYVIIFIRFLGVLIEIVLFFISWLFLLHQKNNRQNLSVS